ncbi:hypothetical protein [Psychrobacillus sp. FSL K6-2843]|uniref:hypothetical protein n=1 Tax=Psychrobacillus sp. FSL K6-2843 TaxID=2921549 RepID=UPI00315A0DF3
MSQQRVRYERTMRVGDCHTTEVAEGTIEDVLKILTKPNQLEITNNITINASPNENARKVKEAIKTKLDKEVKHG